MTKKRRDFDDVIGSITKDEAETILRIYGEYPRSVDSLSIFGEKLSMKIKNLNWMHVEKLVTNAKDVLNESKKNLRDFDDVLKDMTLDQAKHILTIRKDYPFDEQAFSICSEYLSMRTKNLVPDHFNVLVDKAKKIVGLKPFRDYAHLYNNMTLEDAHKILEAKNSLEKKCQFTRSSFCSKLNLDENTTSVLSLIYKAEEVIKRHSLNPRESGGEMINNQKAEVFEQSLKVAFDATNIESILEERGKTHGNFADVAYISQTIKKQMRGAPSYDKTTLTMRQALDVIADKIARIVCGDCKEKDHWIDIEGYAKLQSKELEVKNG